MGVRRCARGGRRRLSKDARLIAGRFVLTAVQRKHLDEAWNLVGPAIRQGMTYKEWLKGNIPVVPYTDAISLAPIKVTFSSKDYALLEIILLPKSTPDRRPVPSVRSGCSPRSS